MINVTPDQSYKAKPGRWIWQLPFTNGAVISGTRTYGSKSAAMRAGMRVLRVVFPVNQGEERG